jgi:hypothetical protein
MQMQQTEGSKLSQVQLSSDQIDKHRVNVVADTLKMIQKSGDPIRGSISPVVRDRCQKFSRDAEHTIRSGDSSWADVASMRVRKTAAA